MSYSLLRNTAVFSFLVAASFAAAQPALLESDWLELVKGHTGENAGVEVVEIEEGATPDMHAVTVAIPKDAMAHPSDIEEVVVVGKMPAKPEPLDISYEWVDDYDNDRYGLLIHIPKDSEWPIRLYINSDSGFTR